MRIVLVLIVVGLAFLGGVAWWMVRTIPHTPIEAWHVDPLTAPNPTTPNYFRMAPRDQSRVPVDAPAPIYAANPALLARTFDDHALRQRDTQRIAGTPESGWMTYVQRSEVFKFPDYISVKFIDLGDGRSTLAIFSRARIGYGDMGVNKARVLDWLRALKDLET